MFQPLAEYKIMDCSRYLPYQYCTLLLADLGAEVLKIEEPGRGDHGRWTDPDNPGKESLSFIMANRNKKSMVVNLKKEAGKKIFRKLAADYDVLLESFRPGVMDKLGLGYQSIRRINPRIIYCSGTGYGQTGPYRLKAGHDINYLSLTGILGAAAAHKGGPAIPGVPFADMAGGGVFPALAIIAALLGRERTGRGQYIDVAMTDVMTSFNLVNIALTLEKRSGEAGKSFNILDNITGNSLCYNTFKTKDGKFVSFGNLETKFWINFCKAVGREDLIEKHHSAFEEGEETTEILKAIFAGKTRSEWVEFMKETDNCFAPVLEPKEIFEDQHVMERKMIARVQDPGRGETFQVGFPAKFSDDLDFQRFPAPELGEHTVEVLKEMGYTREEIHRLKEGEVI